MLADDPVDDRKTDSSPWKIACVVQTLECLEQLSGIRHVETRAIVADEADGLALDLDLADLDLGRRAVAGELPRVADQVVEDDPEEAGIALRLNGVRDLDVRGAV